ncbi:hypothetical protein ABI_27410 [Asticcacaulis biprosthecium C19]|uniref:ATP-dependent Zn protease n=1 Tax=Asticcacaulis biprosthecium C19 TaxID=715226 RepID=F4QM85_9CAUL|nr:DUF1491 family protein [Asticcacaulis biprosthecium]EGF91326.1 hypothetical protein ABI_27410 [Asticcacaulis biprosthecium C19]
MLLSADLWVGALLRRVGQAGSFAHVSRKGDARAGSVIVKVLNQRTLDAYVLREATTGEESIWMRPVETVSEPDLDAWITRQIRYDPDLWVIEIEDAEGRHFLTEKVDLR